MARVCAAMAYTGFSRWEWGTLRASDVGAPHQRNRWFCVAVTDPGSVGREPRPRSSSSEPGELGGNGFSDNSRTSTTDADGSTVGPEPVTVTGCSDTTLVRSNHTAAPHADSLGLQSERSGRLPNGHEEQRGDVDRRRSERFGGYAAAVERWERILGRQAPTPTTGQGRLNPEFVEWMQGLPAGWVTGCGLTRAEQLTVLGNGVVPQQAAAAISLLTAAETAVEAA